MTRPNLRSLLLAVLAAASAAAGCAGAPAGNSASNSPTATPSATASATPSAGGTPFALRIMGANLSSGTGQNWNGGEGRRIVAGVHPDVVMLQEWNLGANSDAELTAFVTSALGTGFSWTRESGAQIPNGI
ncbi:MAG TPA: endonuclease, partial [bacterium]|nr:endonuclease [bacterium]